MAVNSSYNFLALSMMDVKRHYYFLSLAPDEFVNLYNERKNSTDFNARSYINLYLDTNFFEKFLTKTLDFYNFSNIVDKFSDIEQPCIFFDYHFFLRKSLEYAAANAKSAFCDYLLIKLDGKSISNFDPNGHSEVLSNAMSSRDLNTASKIIQEFRKRCENPQYSSALNRLLDYILNMTSFSTMKNGNRTHIFLKDLMSNELYSPYSLEPSKLAITALAIKDIGGKSNTALSLFLIKKQFYDFGISAAKNGIPRHIIYNIFQYLIGDNQHMIEAAMEASDRGADMYCSKQKQKQKPKI